MTYRSFLLGTLPLVGLLGLALGVTALTVLAAAGLAASCAGVSWGTRTSVYGGGWSSPACPPTWRTMPLPRGRVARLDGLAEAPRIGPHRKTIALELLAPNGRAAQTPRDLRSFWERTYREVRKELRRRYPKHPWPEHP